MSKKVVAVLGVMFLVLSACSAEGENATANLDAGGADDSPVDNEEEATSAASTKLTPSSVTNQPQNVTTSEVDATEDSVTTTMAESSGVGSPIRDWDFDTVDAQAWCLEIGQDLASTLGDWSGFDLPPTRYSVSNDGYYVASSGSRDGNCGWEAIQIPGFGPANILVAIYDVPTTPEIYIERWFECCSPRGGDAMSDTFAGRPAAFTRFQYGEFLLAYVQLDNVAIPRPIIREPNSNQINPEFELVLAEALVGLYGDISLTPQALDVPPMVGAVRRG